MTSAIELADVSKVYRKYSGRQFSTLKSALLKRSVLRDLQPSEAFLALKNVSFSVAKGSAVGVIGRNGSGKSTALKLVAGITKPTSGTVTVDGRISALIELGNRSRQHQASGPDSLNDQTPRGHVVLV